jgi:hypothetical protein
MLCTRARAATQWIELSIDFFALPYCCFQLGTFAFIVACECRLLLVGDSNCYNQWSAAGYSNIFCVSVLRTVSNNNNITFVRIAI